MVDPLDENEKQMKRVVQEILIKAGVLNTRTEKEWNIYTTRKTLQAFSELWKRLKAERQQGKENLSKSNLKKGRKKTNLS